MSRLPRCGHYELLALIGDGAGREVWRARDTRTQRRVAIKLFAPRSRHPLAAQQLFDEVQAVFGKAAACDGDTLVPLLDLGLERDRAWVAAEFVDAPTLTDVQADEEISPLRVAELVLAVAEGVDQLHARGFVHANLKLSNVFIEPSGKVKFADPFLVGVLGPRLLEEEFPEPLVSHMAPELISGAPVSALSDQYAIGVIAYRLLGNATPFEGVSSLDYLFATVYMEPIALPVRVAGLGAEVDRVVRRALAKDPGDRFSDCRAFAAALADSIGSRPGEWRATMPASVAPDSPLATPPAPRRPVSPIVETTEPGVELLEAGADLAEPGAELTEPGAGGTESGSPDIHAAAAVETADSPASPSPVDEDDASGRLAAPHSDPLDDPPEVQSPDHGTAATEATADDNVARPQDDLPRIHIDIPPPPAEGGVIELSAAEEHDGDAPAGATGRRRRTSAPGAVWRSISSLWRGRSGRLDHTAWAERDAYNADWRRARRRSVRDSDEARNLTAGPLDPEWELRVQTSREGCQVWVNGVHAAEAPGDLLMRGKSNELVKLELRQGEVVVATKELVLHPLMSKRWDVDGAPTGEADGDPDDSD